MKSIVYVGGDPELVKRFFIDVKVIDKRKIKQYERLAKQGKLTLIVEKPYDKYLSKQVDKSVIIGNVAVAKNKLDLIKILTYLMRR